jgi:hypothetical protein
MGQKRLNMAQGKTATPVSIKENNKVVVTPAAPVELVVVGDHLEFGNDVNKGVVVGSGH